MNPGVPLRLFLDSNVLTSGIISSWGLDKAVLSLCAARICRMVLAEIVREEVEENLLVHATALAPHEAEQVLKDYTNLIKLAHPIAVPLPEAFAVFPSPFQKLSEEACQDAADNYRYIVPMTARVSEVSVCGFPRPPATSRGERRA